MGKGVPVLYYACHHEGMEKNGDIAPNILNFVARWRRRISFMLQGNIPSYPVGKRLEENTGFFQKHSLLISFLCGHNNNLVPKKLTALHLFCGTNS
jgi:hypothetical protein